MIAVIVVRAENDQWHVNASSGVVEAQGKQRPYIYSSKNTEKQLNVSARQDIDPRKQVVGLTEKWQFGVQIPP